MKIHAPMRRQPDRHVQHAGDRPSDQAKHFLLASTSSVYGAKHMPFRETDRTNHPLTLLLRHQEGDRGHGAFLCPLWDIPTHRVPLLHRLRPLGQTRQALFKFVKAALAGGRSMSTVMLGCSATITYIR